MQFASEEYKNYFNSGGFHDAVAVTVDGVPISLVPDGGTVVGAHSIHPQILTPDAAEFNHPANLPPLREHLFVNGAPPAVEYNGLTVRLRLHAFVTPGVRHVRFSIADTDYPDDYYTAFSRIDSALFIKAGSLRTINPAQ